MQIYDVSLTISPDLPVWPGDPAVSLERIQKMEEGANANVTQMSLGAHVGTHVDAPYHFLGGDSPTVEQLSLNLLTGRAYVLHVPDEVDLITAEVLVKAEIPSRTRRLLFKTRNSSFWAKKETNFQTGFVGLSPDAAQFIVEKGIRLVGIDYLSIAPFKQGRPTHRILLEAGVVILEGLNLSAVSPGRYSLYCLPLKLAGSDGAPARAILVGV
jgi:arylformamidase